MDAGVRSAGGEGVDVTEAGPVLLDALILGGGGAGLWLLDDLHRRGYRVLLVEHRELGCGQTASAQGIIHGGMKYTLSGLLTEIAREIREMPALWRECLAGRREPLLTRTRVRADFCYLWRTHSIRSQLGLIGAQIGLRTVPVRVQDVERPAALAACPGEVFRVDEPVIDPVSFVTDLASRHTERLLLDAGGPQFDVRPPGQVESVALTHPVTGMPLRLRPRHLVLTAGAGNAGLRERVGLPGRAMQRRPLHMGLVRGELPDLHGHCVDGARTRVTLTSDRDGLGRRVWQVGGQVAEDGVKMERAEFLQHLRAELAAVLPGVSWRGMEWAAYRVDRAEAHTPDGSRPEFAQAVREGNVITGWPTKMALFPQLSARILAHLGPPDPAAASGELRIPDWPRPRPARPPWETENEWLRFDTSPDPAP